MLAFLTSSETTVFGRTLLPHLERPLKPAALERFGLPRTVVSEASWSSKKSSDAVDYLPENDLGILFQAVCNSVRALRTQLFASGRFLCYLGHQSPTVLTQT